MSDDEIIKALKECDCGDPFTCPFGMYRQNKEKLWGCFARFPHGDPNEPDHGCVAKQAAELIEKLRG